MRFSIAKTLQVQGRQGVFMTVPTSYGYIILFIGSTKYQCSRSSSHGLLVPTYTHIIKTTNLNWSKIIAWNYGMEVIRANGHYRFLISANFDDVMIFQWGKNIEWFINHSKHRAPGYHIAQKCQAYSPWYSFSNIIFTNKGTFNSYLLSGWIYVLRCLHFYPHPPHWLDLCKKTTNLFNNKKAGSNPVFYGWGGLFDILWHWHSLS